MGNVTIYTQPDCPPCKIVKLFLQDKGISFIEKDISKDPQAKKTLIETYQSYSTPTVVVEGKVVTGFNLELLSKMLKDSEEGCP
ncbi:glutaredoxin-like YruB-family protein [Oikeobacillus pervagus]|uniref:Glutaredoxin-like YruB-family protein n=1 Tax=Oikeobacillus pervagus TaxID=1325931 RepID=A0AAJ1SXX0_9BACI|nr:glutaredoxin domain-containing protein [Oikeobacillus pervagus]MDQ0214819.1 glutaredoxin-like YruB-family protein [Oikeobacillus pervagus]